MIPCEDIQVPEGGDRVAHEDSAKESPQAPKGDESNENPACLSEPAVREDAKVLAENGKLGEDQGSVVVPHEGPVPGEGRGEPCLWKALPVQAHDVRRLLADPNRHDDGEYLNAQAVSSGPHIKDKGRSRHTKPTTANASSTPALLTMKIRVMMRAMTLRPARIAKAIAVP